MPLLIDHLNAFVPNLNNLLLGAQLGAALPVMLGISPSVFVLK